MISTVRERPHSGVVATCAMSAHVAQQEVAPERANKWVVLALSGVAAFMTTLDG